MWARSGSVRRLTDRQLSAGKKDCAEAHTPFMPRNLFSHSTFHRASMQTLSLASIVCLLSIHVAVVRASWPVLSTTPIGGAVYFANIGPFLRLYSNLFRNRRHLRCRSHRKYEFVGCGSVCWSCASRYHQPRRADSSASALDLYAPSFILTCVQKFLLRSNA